jgi:hypothetical protein
MLGATLDNQPRIPDAVVIIAAGVLRAASARTSPRPLMYPPIMVAPGDRIENGLAHKGLKRNFFRKIVVLWVRAHVCRYF